MLKSVTKANLAIFVLGMLGLVADGIAIGALVEDGAAVYIWLPIVLGLSTIAAMIWNLCQIMEDVAYYATQDFPADGEEEVALVHDEG